MPLKKPQTALIFNNYIGNNEESSNIVNRLEGGFKELNLFSLIGDFYYDFYDKQKDSLKKQIENFKIYPLDKFISPLNTLSFNEEILGQNEKKIIDLYNKDLFVLATDTDLDIENMDSSQKITIAFLMSLPFSKAAMAAILVDGNKNFVTDNNISIDQKTFALLDYAFSFKNEKSSKFYEIKTPYIKKRQYPFADVIGAKNFFEVNSLTNLQMKSLTELNEGGESTFEFFNIELNNSSFKEMYTNLILPISYYKKTKELNQQLEVPKNSNVNENQILNYYQDLFKEKYKGVEADPITFLYKNYEAEEIETEVMLLSTLLNKTKKYDPNFSKPYVSIEFYVNNKPDNLYGKTSSYMKVEKARKIDYLKDFARKYSQANYKKGLFLKDYKKQQEKIYYSFSEYDKSGTDLENKCYEASFPKSSSLKFLYNPDFTSNANTLASLKKGSYCNYDVIGYIINKSKNDKLIKRIYIMNDVPVEGYIKYFDSQIIESDNENKNNYTYKIEQINSIFGREFAISVKNKTLESYKNSLKEKEDGEIEFINLGSPELINEPNNNSSVIEKEKEELLPFYKNETFQRLLNVNVDQKQMVAYSPLVEQIFESPDLVVATQVKEILPSTPDIKIYSKKGESKEILVMLSNIIAKTTQITGLKENKNSKIIDLGSDVVVTKFPTKEFRVYRTEEKPTSYETFSKTPRKIIDPNNSDFIDKIEPNIIYYYYAEAIDVRGVQSKPSKVIKFQMIEEQNHVFSLFEIYDFGEDKENLTEKIFRKKIKISPTFLQSTVGPKGIVGEYIKASNDSKGYTNKLFGVLDNVTNVIPSHKIRVTSKKTRRRFDINTIFVFENINEFKSIPKNAVLVLEEDLPFGITKEKTTIIPGTLRGSSLKAGETLKKGQYLQSSNGDYIFAFQEGDGNLVVYQVEKTAETIKDWIPVWSPQVGNTGAEILILQKDGNLVLYDKDYNAIWATATNIAGKEPDKLIIENDGKLKLIKEPNNEIWSK